MVRVMIAMKESTHFSKCSVYYVFGKFKVWTTDQKWIWVDPIPRTVVVNLGDMLTVYFTCSFVHFIKKFRGSRSIGLLVV